MRTEVLPSVRTWRVKLAKQEPSGERPVDRTQNVRLLEQTLDSDAASTGERT